MNTTLLSTLSVASSGDPTVSIIKDGKIKFGETDINYYNVWNSPEERTSNIYGGGTTSEEIIEEINEGYLPVLHYNGQICLFKYYGCDRKGVPFVLFDYPNENEEQANKGIETTRGIKPPLSLQYDGLQYLEYLVIDNNGDIYPLSNLFSSGASTISQ